jgi:hypothetical protein
MERSAAPVEAQECYGRRAIVRGACRHRLPCPEAAPHDGALAHIEGLTFVDEAAARAVDLSRLAPPVRESWRAFRSWDEARAWLREADGDPPTGP